MFMRHADFQGYCSGKRNSSMRQRGIRACSAKGQFLQNAAVFSWGRLDHHRVRQINFTESAKRKKADRINLMPMAFFRERGFSGTRSNLRARFSGEPPSLSEIRSFLKATFWAQGSHSEPKSLSKEMDSTARAKRPLLASRHRQKRSADLL